MGDGLGVSRLRLNATPYSSRFPSSAHAARIENREVERGLAILAGIVPLFAALNAPIQVGRRQMAQRVLKPGNWMRVAHRRVDDVAVNQLQHGQVVL